MNERLATCASKVAVDVMGQNIYDPGVELIQVRKQVVMVFQRPNPLPVSIRDNILFSHRLHAKGGGDVHQGTSRRNRRGGPLRTVLLWDKVKDRLKRKATELSLEEQQKLCIARLLPVKPKLLLMDEPCSALDPKGTESGRGTALGAAWPIHRFSSSTHNMAQARRASEE
nr:ATP-binding cassette domain-containing protein [Candidatus Accumulibacter sp. ACC012]